MPWRESVSVDERTVFEGPSTDTLHVVVQNDDAGDGVGWTGWTWEGQVRTEDGLTLIGTFTCDDTGTTSTELVVDCTLVLEVGQELTPGLKYIGGIRGTKAGEAITWVEMDIYPEVAAVQ